jgi:signal transduction histidine kinase
VKDSTVLIVADDGAFARDVMARWQTERAIPTFTVVSGALWQGMHAAASHAAVVGAMTNGSLPKVLRALDKAGTPTICVVTGSTDLHGVRAEFPRAMALRQEDGWLDSLMLLGGEVLRRVQAVERLRKLEQQMQSETRDAALGRYMLDTRHKFNNALTSVLGNAELLMLEHDAVPEQMREQVETIHTMALRLHEMMQRFSSLEAEMQVSEESQTETKRTAQAYASGN